MKRMHLHVTVPDLSQSIRFYETLFGTPPGVVKDDYAKWMLDDPRVNFAISTRARAPGLDHVGIQVDSPAELAEIRAALGPHGLTGPAAFRKVVSGRKLWNYDKKDMETWKAAF